MEGILILLFMSAKDLKDLTRGSPTPPMLVGSCYLIKSTSDLDFNIFL
jgi:hypothetical protein